MPQHPLSRAEEPSSISGNAKQFCEALLDGNATTVQELLTALKPEDVTALVCNKLDEVCQTTALHHALSFPEKGSQLRIVRLLCAKRADPNAADVHGITPLHLAAQHSSKYVIRALLCAGADNLLRTADGRTTVDFAAINPSQAEAFGVVGWPGTGPESFPLDPKQKQRQKQVPEAVGAAPACASTGDEAVGTAASLANTTEARGSNSESTAADTTPAVAGIDNEPSLSWPLLAAAIWFALLGIVASQVIRYFS